jgi:hypothetical protein
VERQAEAVELGATRMTAATRGLVTKAEAQSRSMSPNLFGGSTLSGAA